MEKGCPTEERVPVAPPGPRVRVDGGLGTAPAGPGGGGAAGLYFSRILFQILGFDLCLCGAFSQKNALIPLRLSGKRGKLFARPFPGPKQISPLLQNPSEILTFLLDPPEGPNRAALSLGSASTNSSGSVTLPSRREPEAAPAAAV